MKSTENSSPRTSSARQALPSKRRSNQRRSRRDRIDYGALENRCMLATFIVNTTADTNTNVEDGVVSLREAVIAASLNTAFGDAPAGDANGDVIRFDPSINDSTIFLTHGQIVVYDDVLIQGGDSNITISALGNSRLFDISVSERVGFSKLTFDSGRATVGGAMNLIGSGTTILFETTFTNNVATGAGGGAIYYANGSMFITNSTFNGNSAIGLSGSGGALYQASGNIYASGGLMDANSARGSGGAIDARSGTFFSVDMAVGSTTGGNFTLPVGSPIVSDGGGLHVAGNARVTVQGGEYVGNLAARNGGGMWVGEGGQLFVRPGTQINNNQAGGSSVGKGGGGIFNSGGKLYVNRANISSNLAAGPEGSGGGIHAELKTGKTVLNNAIVDSNAARQSGGGIQIDGGLLQLTNSTVSNNDVGNTFTSTLGHGGGIYVGLGATLVVDDGQVRNNSATMQGGGIWADNMSIVFLRGFANIGLNTVTAPMSIGGGMYTQGYLQARDSFFQGNFASIDGGALYLSGTTNSRIDNTNFFDNTAGIRGGGIFNNSSMFITNATFAGNVVNGDGGGYFTAPTATTLAQNVVFTGNMPNSTNE